ncbi:MAG: ABC transporter substrate-binding protein [Acidimicrobiia bacterium]|nr:ABC transporter substrate-binding protein [Acidimicrobiia bacterium]
MNDNLRRWLPWIAVGAVAIIVIIIIAVNSGGDDEAADTTTTTAAEDTTTTTVEETTTTSSAEETTTTTEAAPVGEPLNLASLLPLTGDLAAFGPGMANSVQLAADEANAAGGVNGSQVTYNGFDSGTSAEVAQPAADEIVAGGNQAIVGAAGSDVSLSVIDKLTGSGVVMVSPSNTSPQFTGLDPLYFRTAPSDALQGEYTAALLAARGVNNVAIIYRQDSYGEGLRGSFVEAFSGGVAIEIPYNPEELDAASVVTQVVNAGPDAVLFIGFPETGVPIHQEAFKQELLKTDQSIPWFYTDGLLDPTFVGSTGLDAALFAGFEGTAPGTPEGDAAAQFATRYQDAFGAEFTLFAPNTYDAAWLIMLAAQASDGTSAGIQGAIVDVSKGGEKCIAEACLALLQADPSADIDYVGASGEIDFKDSGGDPGSALFQVWAYTDTGETERTQLVNSPSEIE